MEFVDTRLIELPGGDEVEVKLTQLFVDKLTIYYELESSDDLTDDHVRMFIWGSLDPAKRKDGK